MTSSSKQIVLGVDLDGVCTDFYGKMREIAAEWFERPLDDLTPDVTFGLRQWGIQSDDQYKSLHRFAVIDADIYIDDAPANVESLRGRGLRTICFANSTNKSVDEPRAKDWDEVYQLIKDLDPMKEDQ